MRAGEKRRKRTRAKTLDGDKGATITPPMRCVASCRRPLAGSRRFPQFYSNLPREAMLPLRWLYQLPFYELTVGNTLRCKLFLFDKFHKIFLYFDDRIKYNEVKDKSGVVELTH